MVGDEFHDGVLPLPGHRLGKLEHGVNRVEQGPVPMVFENAPTAFQQGCLFTVIVRVACEPNRDVIVLHEVDEPLHKLGAPTMILRVVIQIDDQRRDVGKALADGLPPLCEAVYQAVTGHFRGHAVHEELLPRSEKQCPRQSRSPRGQSHDRRLPPPRDLLPPRKGPILTVALASMETRNTSAALSAA